ncbi:hypothetical protein PSI15_14505 [Xenorhabdus sp. PR6a]|uniref:hypothetical protein n=1 Tax=Xenorhabdus sp. PR6a TaxID=3025877 RepID=UPI0023585514|nr:hypothetical protein [Xenorhabdus sp. PR6a]MDC9582761.1 hypothetical protein [Xenorhabdus sp. PR6a]
MHKNTFVSTKTLINFMRNKYGEEVSYTGKPRETKAFGFYTHENPTTRFYNSPTHLKSYVYIKESLGVKENTPFRVVIYPFDRIIQQKLENIPAAKNNLIAFNHSILGMKTVKSTGYVKFTTSTPNTPFGIEVAIFDVNGLEQLITFINKLHDGATVTQAAYPPSSKSKIN